MKANKLLLFTLIALVFLPNVLAQVDVQYIYKDSTTGNFLNDVTAAVYTCLDSSCLNVKIPAFTGSSNVGNSNDNPPDNDLIFHYPTNLETQDGYAVYHFKSGYLPKEFFVDWNGGDSNPATDRTATISFNKKSSCSAHINDFVVFNDVKPNIPLVVDVSASLDATTYSAFSLTAGTPEYIPQAYKDEFYSAETTVTLRIYDSNNNLVHTDHKLLNLFADSSKRTQFTWIPTKAGNYKATITTDVTDDQCSSSIPQEVSKDFRVLQDEPKLMCYTILNNLHTDDTDPATNQEVKVLATKISNQADESRDLSPVATDVKLTVTKDSVKTYEVSKHLERNPNKFNPVPFTFDWTPAEAGFYTLKLYGIANDVLCSGLPNDPETVSQNIIVTDQPSIRLELNQIGNKQINENDLLQFKVTANYNGAKKLTFFASSLPQDATFDPVTQIFSWQTDSQDAGVYKDVLFGVTDGVLADHEAITITVVDVIDGNHAPVLEDIENKNVNEGQRLNFFINANDQDNDRLTFSITNKPSGATFDSVNKEFDWTPSFDTVQHDLNLIEKFLAFLGVDLKKEFKVTFTVKDSKNAIDNEVVTITVFDVNRNPVLDFIRDITVQEGQLVKITPRATDADNDQLKFSFTAPLNSNGEWLTKVGDAGNYKITVTVEDNFNGKDSQDVNIKVIQKTQNTAPELLVSDQTVVAGKILRFKVKATDRDNDALSFSATNLPNGATFDPVTQLFEWKTTLNDIGIYSNVEFSVSDGQLSDTETITIKVLSKEQAQASKVKESMVSVSSLFLESEELNPGENLVIWTRVRNTGNTGLEDVKVTATLPEFGVTTAKTIDLVWGQTRLLIFSLELPNDVEPGFYVVKISANNNNAEDVRYVEYEVN